MTCPEKLYVSRAFDIPITIATGANYVAADISELVITLTLTSNQAVTNTWTKSLSEITVVGSVITLLILASDVTTEGFYKIKIDMTDTGGKVRGITPCPETLQFHEQ